MKKHNFLIDKAQQGLELIKDAVFELVKATPAGITNAQVTKSLGLQSDNNGKQKNYLAYSVLGILMHEGKVRKDGKEYFARFQ